MARSPYARFGVTTNPAPAQTTRRVVVVASTEIPAIAARAYGDGYSSEAWRQIAEANEVLDLDALTAGTVLAIPSPQPAST